MSYLKGKWKQSPLVPMGVGDGNEGGVSQGGAVGGRVYDTPRRVSSEKRVSCPSSLSKRQEENLFKEMLFHFLDCDSQKEGNVNIKVFFSL